VGGGMVPVIEQEHFRIRTDGTAADPGTPTWLAAEDTNGTLTVSGNTNVRIRFVVAETAGNAANSDYSIYYSKNAGSYLAVSGSSSNVQFADASTSADGTALTTANYQLTAGTGTAANGEYSEDAVVSTNITGNNYVEQEYGLVIIDADVANNDTLDFRVYYNGAAADVYDVTPRITVSKATFVDMDSAATSTSTVAAALDAQIGFDSTTTSASTVAASVSVLCSLDSALLSSSSVAALANALRSIDTGISGTSTLSSDMEVVQLGAEVDLDSSISGTSTVAGALDPQPGLLSSIASGSTVAAEINILEGMVAAMSSTGTLSASLNQFSGHWAAIASSSTVAAEINALLPFQSAIASASSLDADINISLSLDSTATSNSTVSGELDQQQGFQSSILGASSVNAELDAPVTFDSSIVSASTVSGEIDQQQGFDSALSSDSTVAAELDNPGTVDLDVSITSSATVTGWMNRIMSPDASLPEISAANASLNVLADIASTIQAISSDFTSLQILLGLESSNNDAPSSSLAADFVLLRSLTAVLQETSQVNPALSLNMGLAALFLAESSIAGLLDGVAAPDPRGDTILGETLQGDVVLGKTLMGDVAMAETVIGGMSMGETLMGDVLMGETPQGHVIL